MKRPTINDNIRLSSDFTYEPYYGNKKANGKLGFSGNLLLATEKSNSQNQYVVKYEQEGCALGEFLYSKISNILGYNTLPTFFLGNTEEKSFPFPAVAIKYLPNAKAILKSELSATQVEEYLKNVALSTVLLDEDLTFDYLISDDILYCIDHADAFASNIIVVDKNELANMNVKDKIFTQGIISLSLLKTAEYIESVPQDIVDTFGEITKKYYNKALFDFSKIKLNKLEPDLQTLEQIYDDEVVSHLRKFLKRAKNNCALIMKYGGAK